MKQGKFTESYFWDGTLGVYEMCPICLWEDDPTQSVDPEYEGGANGRSLIEARRQWLIQKQSR
ncbi:CPCC family cysteine-rich protein [Ralstonia pseudosolanacearum]|uniref:CPCC family cysteine-rich protein n=1 Tax=Ralstonia pseudosolanacearum TaxID=1310165 RepID=UPI002E24A1DC